jgi:hypothetical protein
MVCISRLLRYICDTDRRMYMEGYMTAWGGGGGALEPDKNGSKKAETLSIMPSTERIAIECTVLLIF